VSEELTKLEADVPGAYNDQVLGERLQVEQ
jgi:hypothetical protein